jgi:hypothetical protein
MNTLYKIDTMVVSVYSIRIDSCNQECDSFPFILFITYRSSSFSSLFSILVIGWRGVSMKHSYCTNCVSDSRHRIASSHHISVSD